MTSHHLFLCSINITSVHLDHAQASVFANYEHIMWRLTDRIWQTFEIVLICLWFSAKSQTIDKQSIHGHWFEKYIHVPGLCKCHNPKKGVNVRSLSAWLWGFSTDVKHNRKCIVIIIGTGSRWWHFLIITCPIFTKLEWMILMHLTDMNHESGPYFLV